MVGGKKDLLDSGKIELLDTHTLLCSSNTCYATC